MPQYTTEVTIAGRTRRVTYTARDASEAEAEAERIRERWVEDARRQRESGHPRSMCHLADDLEIL